MFMLVLTIAGGVFLVAILGFVVWVAAFRHRAGTLSIADAPQGLNGDDAATRGDYIGGSGRPPGDYVGGGPFF